MTQHRAATRWEYLLRDIDYWKTRAETAEHRVKVAEDNASVALAKAEDFADRIKELEDQLKIEKEAARELYLALKVSMRDNEYGIRTGDGRQLRDALTRYEDIKL